MEPININRIERGCDVRQSNYALIGKPVGLNCRVLQVSRPVEIDRWEDEAYEAVAAGRRRSGYASWVELSCERARAAFVARHTRVQS